MARDRIKRQTSDNGRQEAGDGRQETCGGKIHRDLCIQSPVGEYHDEVTTFDLASFVVLLAVVSSLGDTLIVAFEARILQGSIREPIQHESSKNDRRQSFDDEEVLPDWHIVILDMTDSVCDQAAKSPWSQ